jgi:hypothetical protein
VGSGWCEALSRRRSTSAPAGDPFQGAFDGAGSRKEVTVELIKDVARRKEHESAGDTNGDTDGTAVELDGKTLTGH